MIQFVVEGQMIPRGISFNKQFKILYLSASLFNTVYCLRIRGRRWDYTTWEKSGER